MPTNTPRAEARARGATRYFTGEPCMHGHIAERIVSNNACSVCHRKRVHEREARDPAKRYAMHLKWKDANLERHNSAIRRWHAEHKDEVREYQAQYRIANEERLRAKRRENYIANREERLRKVREYAAANPELISARRRIYNARRRAKKRQYMLGRFHNDPLYKLRQLLRSRLQKAIRKGYRTGSAVRHLGCSISFLKGYLEHQFQEGMSWQNWGPIWHIDHIKPLASFDLTDEAQLRIVCHYKNLQPLFAGENLRKGARITYPLSTDMAQESLQDLTRGVSQ